MTGTERLELLRELDRRMTPLCCDDCDMAQQLLFMLIDVLGGTHAQQYLVTPHDDLAQEFFSKLKLKFPYDHPIYDFVDVVDDDGNTIDWRKLK